MKYVVATFLLCLQLAAAAEDAAAETPAVISACPATDLSASASPSKYYCDKIPSYTVGGTPAVTNGCTAPSGTVAITLSPALSLTTATQCGATTTTPVTCSSLNLNVGTADDKDDGSKIVLGNMKFDGLAHWSCSDSTPTTSLTLNYYFLVKVDGTNDNTDTNAGTTITEVNKALVGTTPATAASVDSHVFEKFGAVDKDTKIYFFKQSDTVSHTVFYSDETLIKFSTTQFGNLINGATLSEQTAAPACNNAVLFCFEDGCEKSGAAALLSGTMMMLIPIIFTQF